MVVFLAALDPEPWLLDAVAVRVGELDLCVVDDVGVGETPPLLVVVVAG